MVRTRGSLISLLLRFGARFAFSMRPLLTARVARERVDTDVSGLCELDES